jgi:hypothetical protein
MNRKDLSISEWTTILKMNGNIAAVRSIPGRSQDNHCRHKGCNEIETLGHVLGSCKKSELLRNNRHHKIRNILANAFRNPGWEVFEEVCATSNEGSQRRIDIVAINRKGNKALVIDPTIRTEVREQQAEEIDEEKKSIYEPCIPYLKEKYDIDNWIVRGLFIGSRGTITKFFLFLKEQKLN